LFRRTALRASIWHGQSGSLEDAQRIAGHASARTTKGYDHTDKALTLNEINRINYFGSSAANTVTPDVIEVRSV